VPERHDGHSVIVIDSVVEEVANAGKVKPAKLANADLRRSSCSDSRLRDQQAEASFDLFGE
jgi:hypothetical protein